MAKLTPKRAVKGWLALNGKTLGWLAQKLDVSDAMLSMVLSGYRNPNPTLNARVLKLTGIDLINFNKPAQPAPEAELQESR